MKPKIILGVAGKMGSGKSTVSHEFAESMGWPYASFGNYVRYVARQRGLNENSTEVLQEIGEALVETDPKGFCRSVLEYANWRPDQSLIVDGIRHVEITAALQQLTAPSKFVLTYVDVDENTRKDRLIRERGVRPEQLELLEAHPTEAQVRSKLPQLADYRLNANVPVEALVNELRRIYADTLRGIESAAGKDQVVEQGQRIYDEQLKHRLEPEQNGCYVAIEPDSGRYFLGDTGTEALVTAHAEMPDARFYLKRIGHLTTHNVGGYASRNR